MGAVTRVLLADDHVPTRAALRSALESRGRFKVCAESGTAYGAVAAAVEHKPDVALLDIRMPGNGIEAAREIAMQCPETAIVMLTVSRDDADLFDALSAGARGYLLKDIDHEQLPRALQGVIEGEAALPRSLVARLVDEFRIRESAAASARPQTGPFAALTEREWDVLGLMRAGLSTGEIAARLFVTPVTVRTHVSAIMRKLHVPDRQALRNLNAR
jgi:DNA-binding NarL/FixJ family response regulator